MNRERLTSEKAVDRFLESLAEPGSSRTEVDRSADRMLRYLEGEYVKLPTQRLPAWDGNRRRTWLRWTAFAAASIAVAAALMLFRVDTSVIAKVEAGTINGLKNGGALHANQSLRVGNSAASIWLEDGSRVELSPDSGFSIRHVSDGIEVHLAKGNVIVTASAQKMGHLYVRTPDCTVSVTGTVFAVRAEDAGSRISVYEGQVRVVQRNMSYTLSRGEQLATTPVLGAWGLETEIQWSRNPQAVLALLQPSVQSLPHSPPPSSIVLPGEESIEGILTDVTTGSPLPDAAILLGQRNNPRTLAEVKTGKDGRFEIERVAPGTYYLLPSRAGFWAPDPPSVDVTVVAGRAVQNVRLRMISSATVSGRLTDENGDPVRSASLILMRLEYSGLRRANSGADGGTTNERGEYEFTGVLPGKYYIKLPRDASRGTSIYYPGTANPDDAVPVDLQPGTITTNINFVTPSVKLYSVRFGVPKSSLLWFDVIYRPMSASSFTDTNIRIPSAQVPANPTVFTVGLRPKTKIGDLLNNIGPADLSAIGNDEYLISRVPPGKYRLYLEWGDGMQKLADGNRAESRASVEAEVEITDKDVDLGKLASKPRNLSVPVHFTFANGPEIDVTVSAISGDSRDAVNSRSAARPLRLNNLAPGSYRLMFDVAADHYISLARYGVEDVLSTPLLLDGVDRGVLEIVVDGPRGSVEGTVRDAKGEAAANQRVVLVPAPYQRGDSYQRTDVWTTADQGGRFRFSGVVPGDYRAYSWEFSVSTPDAEWYTANQTRGTLVSVRRGQTVTADVRQIPQAR